MDDSKIQELKLIVESCQSDPSILHNPSLGFFKTFLQSLGAKTPPASSPMGDPSIEVNDESRDLAQSLKSKASEAISEGNLDEAFNHLTEAITLYPSSAILYATRASVFVKLRKPNAAIRDADAALQINADSAKGYKMRGMARAMLGLWEDAARDLGLASNLDHDEEIASTLKKIEPNVHKIKEHRRKYERLRKERKIRQTEQEKQKTQAETEHVKASAQTYGEVVSIHKASELETRLTTSSKSNQLAILYFTATWCGPCRFMAPLYANLAAKYPKMLFLKIDIDESSDVAAKWNISSVPSFFFTKYGKEIDKVVGADKASLETKLAKYAS
ncbi:hypothetical protein L1987_76244 [Smallanthus sonchifolius]|uniref:Uncharacterized protein n=1 Tax=Smallanthus sonchifolius TaxID=185202 RepID=A0ACB9A771_9ASTR|nr:hypothetical protein L1987_76244 [Smallanthus sonchifolius]